MNWDNLDIKAEIELGEDSSRQFKVQMEDANKLAEEMCAFSNSWGGIIYIGVDNKNNIVGIKPEELEKYNQLVSNSANNNIKPSIYPLTKSVKIDDKLLLLIYVFKGANKPYCTTKGNNYYVKSGSDKKMASSQELARMFQESNLLFIDEMLTGARISNENENDGVDLLKFYTYYEKSRGTEFRESGISVEKALENMNLAKNGNFNLAGLLLFARSPQQFKPSFIIRCVSFYGADISDDTFIDKTDCIGTLEDQYRSAIIFLKNNLRLVQQPNGSFNQPGSLEISEKALEEVIVNALFHRDYSKNAVIRILIFKDRVEVISPGCLPNHLTVEHIINNNSVIRNSIIVSHASKMLPYSGIGSGIRRILNAEPNAIFKDDKSGEQFTTILPRKEVNKH